MTLELDTEQIIAAITAFVRQLGLPVDWKKGITFVAWDGDGEALEIEILTATLALKKAEEAGDAQR